MSREAPHLEDPLIEEVRERRKRMFAELGNDLDALYRAVERRQQEHPDQVVDRPKPTQDRPKHAAR